MRRFFLILLALGFGICQTSVSAAELLPSDRSIDQAIDHYVDSLMQKDKIRSASQLDDAALIRRLTLDLIGRIPTTQETAEFIASKDPQKRALLVERLMASPAFIRYQAYQFELMFATPDGKSGGNRDYFLKALTENKSWDVIFREIITPDETKPEQKGASEFLRSRIADLDRLTNDVSVVFFGVNVSCAQCHDHPLVEDWKQDHFYGMKSFFSRTYDAGGFLGEREYGLVKFKPTKGPEKPAKMMFLTGSSIDSPTIREPNAQEQKTEKEKLDKSKQGKMPPPAPSFSARAKLVELALQEKESEFFSRSIVNRLWHRLMGQAIVYPIDQMHSANQPSHPELLQWLARDMREHRYDLRRMIQGIAMSKTYSRSSKWEVADSPLPHAKYYAVGQVKTLTPIQLAVSMKLATSDQSTWDKMKTEELEKKMTEIENSARGFASLIARPMDNLQIGVNEALLFNNSDRINKEFLTDANGTLLGKLKTSTNAEEIVQTMFNATLGRKPTQEESAAFTEFLNKRKDRLPEAQRHLLWSILASAEFRFNP